jgi:hypothetical protein
VDTAGEMQRTREEAESGEEGTGACGHGDMGQDGQPRASVY